MVSVCVLPVKFASNTACCCPFEAANTAVFHTYYNVNAPGENFGSHRGRFFVFFSAIFNRVAAVRRTVLPKMLHPHGAWGR